ncbi:MAG: hypothetical protein KF886_17705 [Candidatus Hydrogenedentes bacterium]|nr:hypothetical protein [Candidatus Hydrogenedentota bacterium]
MRNSTRFHVQLTGLILAGVALQAGAGEPHRPSDILPQLRDFDSAYTSSVSVSGTDQRLSTRVSPELERTWQFSAGNGYVAVVSRAREFPAHVGDAREWMAYVGTTTLVTEVLATIVEIKADPNSTAARADDIPLDKQQAIVSIQSGDSQAFSEPVKRVLWSMGRGFASHIDAVESVSEVGEGTLDVRGSGRGLLDSQIGWWRLTIEPEKHWMVRSASFYQSAEDERAGIAFLHMENHGARVTEGRFIPEWGRWRTPSMKEGESVTITFETIAPSENAELLRQALEHSYGPYARQTTLIDHRNPSIPLVMELGIGERMPDYVTPELQLERSAAN